IKDFKPIEEFGTNYPEFYHKGEEAIEHLLKTKSGQVQGAFYRKDLEDLSGNGEIDLVWGDSKFGLKHILDKHAKEFDNLPQNLSNIIQKGEMVKTHNGYNIVLGNYKAGLNIGWNKNGEKVGQNKWIVTAFDNSKKQSEKYGSSATSFTKEAHPLNSDEIIPQNQHKHKRYN
ncbi:MAG: hypothetical protein K2I63_04105, partial [Helicobacter sp.]|nr:hypothetical protein [Helicobacter sp.]